MMFRETIDRLAPCAERSCTVANFDRTSDFAVRGATSVIDQVYVVAARAPTALTCRKSTRAPGSEGRMGRSRWVRGQFPRADDRQLDENGRFEGGSVLDRAESEGLLENPGTGDSPRDRHRGDRTQCLVCPILSNLCSTIPAIVRHLRRGKVAICGNTSRKFHDNAGRRRAVGAVARAKAREPELPRWRAVDRRLHPTRTRRVPGQGLKARGSSPAGTGPLILAFTIRGRSDRDKGPPEIRVG